MPRRSKIHPQLLVPLSATERVAAELLALHGRRHLRPEAQRLLDEGAPEHDLHDLRRVVTNSLCGFRSAVERWSASTPHAVELAADRVRHLQDSALWVTIVHETGDWRGPGHTIYMGSGSGLPGPPGYGLAWRSGSGVDPSIVVRRYPLPVQLDLFEPQWDE